MEDFVSFIRDEIQRKGFKTAFGVQLFCRKHNIKIRCFNCKAITPTKIKERNIALNVYKNHFCLFSKANTISFNKAIEELKIKFKVIDNFLSDKHVRSFIN